MEVKMRVCVLFLLWIITAGLPFYAVAKKERVLDLGAIEIKGEVRRPNIDLIYSKKSFDTFVGVVARSELKAFEKELLKPARIKKHLRQNKKAVR